MLWWLVDVYNDEVDNDDDDDVYVFVVGIFKAMKRT